MKIKLMVSRARYDEIANELQSLGIKLDNSSTLVLTEENICADFIMGKQNDSYSPVPIEEIVYIDTLGSDVIMHTMNEDYIVSERLVRLEGMLDSKLFLRVSNCAIVSVKRIHKIRPTFSSKFILTLENGANVDVTRSYSAHFKEFFGL